MIFGVPLLVNIAVGFATTFVGYLLMPKPKGARPAQARDMDNPTATQGRPPVVPFGEHTIVGVNIIDFREKSTRTRKVKA